MNTTSSIFTRRVRKNRNSKILNLLDEELVGLAPVKARIREIAALLLIDKLRNNLGITSANPGYTCHLQVAGTGKQQLV
jgi:hypothetical protein